MSGPVQSAGDLAVNQAMGGPALMNRFARKNSGHTVDQSAKDFEGMFMSQMLQPMFDTVGVDSLFGGGHGEEVMRGFLVQEYGKTIAKGTHFGIADAVRAEMIRAQQKSAAGNQAQNKGVANAAEPIQ